MTRLKEIISLIKGDITKVTVDAIVNAANTSLLGGGGVDGAIHRAGGPSILDECRKIIARQGGCKTGQAVITPAGNLPAKFVIHTVGPVWNEGKNDERQKLADCYKNSLQLALDNNCKTIAFPCISTGVYKFPENVAAIIAVDTVLEFLSQTDKVEKVVLVCFDDTNFYFVNGNLNYKVFTVPSKLLADKELLGTVDIGLADDGMGVLSGNLVPTDKYKKYSLFLRSTLIAEGEDGLIRINKFTRDNNFKVITDDGTEFKDPVAGLLIYDFETEVIEVELCGINSEIWRKYFKT